MRRENSLSLKEMIIEDLRALGTSTAEITEFLDDLHFQLMMAEIVNKLSNPCQIKKQSADLRRLAARFGNAHFFYNEKGDFCLLAE